jgi:signal transduction histidine kinase
MTNKKNDRLDFVDAVIHELKTSLTAIIVSVELLDAELKPEEQTVIGRLIHSITRNAHSIDERLTLLSETGEMVSDNAHFNPVPINMKEIIQDTANQLYPTIQNKKQTLTLDIADSLPKARADRQYLEQILLTLMNNACKFTGENGQLKVGVSLERANLLLVEISDTGIGIPAEEQHRIWEPYYQVKSGQTNNTDDENKKGRGGLGLAIAKFLVELHRGKIWLESKTGQGSSFYFTLPTVAAIESSSS